LVFYLGLAGLLVAWLGLGRLLIQRAPGLDVRVVRRIALGWLVPLAVAAPVGSRDVWAYAAQSQLTVGHLNPYRVGPGFAPAAFAVEVDPRWAHTPAPYGPLWLSLGHLVALVVGPHVGLMVAVLRVVAVLGLLLLAWTLPTLAGRAGGRGEVAVWLVVANPLVLVLGVGGGHNDLLMLGLMGCGLVVATGPGRMWRTLGLGTVLIAAAAAVKSPALVAAAFLVPLWLQRDHTRTARHGRRTVAVSCLLVAAVTVAVFAVITELSRLGWGWVHQLNPAQPLVYWMSLPTLAAICWKLAHGVTHKATAVDATMHAFRTTGSLLSIAALTGLWLRALRRAAWPLLAVALCTLVILGPSVQPWYFCWPLVIAAVVPLTAANLTTIAGASIALVVMIRPNGTGLQMNPAVTAIIAGSALLSWLIMTRTRRQSRPPHPAATPRSAPAP
jgi:alpha-1,6-mannosyltransferase